MSGDGRGHPADRARGRRLAAGGRVVRGGRARPVRGGVRARARRGGGRPAPVPRAHRGPGARAQGVSIILSYLL